MSENRFLIDLNQPTKEKRQMQPSELPAGTGVIWKTNTVNVNGNTITVAFPDEEIGS